jgi:hypothetical protein
MNKYEFTEFMVAMAQTYLAYAVAKNNEAEVVKAESLVSKHLATWYAMNGQRDLAKIEAQNFAMYCAELESLTH